MNATRPLTVILSALTVHRDDGGQQQVTTPIFRHDLLTLLDFSGCEVTKYRGKLELDVTNETIINAKLIARHLTEGSVELTIKSPPDDISKLLGLVAFGGGTRHDATFGEELPPEPGESIKPSKAAKARRRTSSSRRRVRTQDDSVVRIAEASIPDIRPGTLAEVIRNTVIDIFVSRRSDKFADDDASMLKEEEPRIVTAMAFKLSTGKLVSALVTKCPDLTVEALIAQNPNRADLLAWFDRTFNPEKRTKQVQGLPKNAVSVLVIVLRKLGHHQYRIA